MATPDPRALPPFQTDLTRGLRSRHRFERLDGSVDEVDIIVTTLRGWARRPESADASWSICRLGPLLVAVWHTP